MAHELPVDIKERLKRGSDRKDRDAGMRNLCMEFVRGNQYMWLGDEGGLYDQRGFVSGSANPGKRHRVRQTRNLIKPIVDEKVSAATQRVPSYEINPSTYDYDDLAAASLSEKIAVAGYDTWNIRDVTARVCWYSFVADEGFAMPYWDSTVGPYVETENGPVGQGEVKIRIIGANEAYWEPGVNFDDSRWHAVEYAQPIDEVTAEQGYIGPKKLKADANAQGGIVGRSRNTDDNNLVIITEYFQRPSPEEPDGLKMVIANGGQIYETEPFPVRDGQNKILDEPPFLRLAYSVDPDSDRDQGFVRHLVDAQRTINDVINKILEWKNIALVPQLLAPENSLLNRPTSTPGDVTEYRSIPGMSPPQWRDVPPIPQELFQIKQEAHNDMKLIAHASDLPPGEIGSGKEAIALIEQQQVAWSHFLNALSEFHSRLMRQCLTLVQRHYTEPRLVKYRGWLGWEQVEDFRGADLRGQTDVRVLPGSLEPRSRRGTEQKVMNWAQLGWVSPEAAMSAIEGGNAEKLIDRNEASVRRGHRVIMQIRRDPEALLNAPMRPTFPTEQVPDPETGLPAAEVPGWMPRPFDNVPVLKTTFESWMQSDDYENLDPPQMEAAHLYYAGLLELERLAAERALMLQNEQAAEQGMQNATRPAKETPNPSLPGLTE